MISTIIIDFMGENKYQLNYKKCIDEYHKTYKQGYRDSIIYINHYDDLLSCNLNSRFVNFIFRYPSYIHNFIKNKRNVATLPTNYYL